MRDEGKPEEDGRRPITRRALLSLAAMAGLSMFLPAGRAFGVGGGGWGSNGGWAYIGATFGYDGDWGYSKNKTVWLSVRASCEVRRMSELLCEISVTSYYANGGKWSPTWSTDYPDTHVRSLITNSDQTVWLSSATGFYDTTYDNSSYHGPYVTDVHTIRRESYDYEVKCAVNAWCDSPDNAYGIDTYAIASQWIPHHVLNDDKSWRLKIFTMQPKSSPGYYLDASGGGVGNGTNLNFWEKLDTTSQCWIACNGARGLTVLEPAHVADANMCIDHSGGAADVWGSAYNVHLWSYLGNDNQLLWLHDLGNGYHYPVFHHSGMALDHVGSSCSNGTQSIMWNSYAAHGTAGATCSYKLEEVTWKERFDGAMTVAGSPMAGEALTPADPNEKCIPYNYPGTKGMYYKYTWYRGEEEGSLTTVVQGPSETGPYVVQREDEGSFLTCVVEARTRYWDIKYKGEVTCPSTFVPYSKATVSYYADGEADPCFEEESQIKDPYNVNPDASVAATRADCAGLEGWYVDEACTVHYSDGSVLQGDLKLFARNKLTLGYATASNAFIRAEAKDFYVDEACTSPLDADAEAALYPGESTRYYGDTVAFESSPDVYYEDMGRVRPVSRVPGAFATDPTTGTAMLSAKLTRNTVVYCDWRAQAYDGVTLRQ